MSFLVAPLLILLGVLPPEALEAQASRRVVQEFERVGRTAPSLDPALQRAARTVARNALATSAAEAAELLNLAEAVSAADGCDPSPRALVLRGGSEELQRAIQARTDLNEEPTSAVGIGAFREAGTSALVILFANRKASLRPFARRLDRPGPLPRPLCGELVSGLRAADVYVTRPSGKVDKVVAQASAEQGFCAMLTFADPGEHTVEVIARGDRGPEVVALFFVQVGAVSGRSAAPRQLEPVAPEEARVLLAGKINALRGGAGAGALTREPVLDRVAQAYAEQMSRDHFFAHVDPEGVDLKGRLTRAGYRYRSAGENLGLAGGPLAAHFGIEHSPGHRSTLLDPAFTRLGIGVGTARRGDRTEVIVTEVLALPVDDSRSHEGPRNPGEPGPLEYRVILSRRQQLKLPPLKRNAGLERLALEHLRRAIAEDHPSVSLSGPSLHDQVFSEVEELASISVDVFVIGEPELIVDSKNLGDPRNDQVGLAALRVDSAHYGPNQLWTVVIYGDSR